MFCPFGRDSRAGNFVPLRINAKSIMGMMSLGLCAGEELTVAAEGADEQTAVDNIEKFLSGRVA